MLVQEMKGAKKVVDMCANIQPGEDVLIVSDWPTFTVAERISAAANELGANVMMTLMDPREHDGNEPPAAIGAAMLEADVIILPVKTSISHASAMAEALENGARRISMVGFTPTQLVEGGINCDYEAMAPICEEMADRFGEATTARVTSDAGTDVEFDLTERRGNAHTGLAHEPGDADSVVHVEANTSPVDGETNGTMVFDGAVPNLGIGVLENDIIMEVEDGQVVEIDGGWEAKRIEAVWEEYDIPAVYNIAQLAVGMNPECPEFNGWFSNDHGVYGSVHVGIGTSTMLGGVTRAPVHFDAMMEEPRLELDSEVVLENKEFKL